VPISTMTSASTATEQKLVVAAQDENDAITTWKNIRTAAYVGLGVGGAAMITGAVFLLASPTADAKTGPRVRDSGVRRQRRRL